MSLFDKYIDAIPVEEPEPMVVDIAVEEKAPSDEKDLDRTIKEDQLLEEESNSLISELIEYFTTQDPQSLTQLNRGIITKEDFLKLVTNWLHKRGVRQHFIPIVIEKFSKYMWGYYILEDFLQDDEISDIKVLGPDNVRIKRLGRRMATNVKFKDVKDFRRFVGVVATKNQTNLSDINAEQTFTDMNYDKCFLRFCVSTEYINSVPHPYLAIRKTPKNKKYLSKLIKEGMLDENTAQYLAGQVKTAHGILVCGKGSAGKTTLINAMIEEIPHNKAVYCIQENVELFSYDHPDIMFKQVVTANGEGKIEYTLKDLAIAALRYDIDFFTISELKGDESLYFLNACLTGNQVMASIHSNSSTEAIDTLAVYIKNASDYSMEDVMRMLSCMSTVVFIKDYKVAEISEIVGFDEETKRLRYKRIYKREGLL